jgi:hypothetical protein
VSYNRQHATYPTSRQVNVKIKRGERGKRNIPAKLKMPDLAPIEVKRSSYK